MASVKLHDAAAEAVNAEHSRSDSCKTFAEICMLRFVDGRIAVTASLMGVAAARYLMELAGDRSRKLVTDSVSACGQNEVGERQGDLGAKASPNCD